MNNFINAIKAELFKVLLSKIFLLHIIIPAIGISIFAGYYSYSSWNEEDKIFGFIQVVVLAFPLMIAIVTSMIEEQEAKAGNFHNILSVPYSRVIEHSSKLIVIGLIGLFASVFTIMGFGIIFRLMGYVAYPIIVYLKLSVLIFALNFELYIIQYMVSFSFGKGMSLGLGVLGTLMSPLLYFGLANGFWYYIPFGWGVRMSTYYFYKVINSEMFNVVSQDYKMGSLIITTILIITIIIFLLWTKKWQGKSCKSE